MIKAGTVLLWKDGYSILVISDTEKGLLILAYNRVSYYLMSGIQTLLEDGDLSVLHA